MNGRAACKNVKFTKPDSRSPSGAETDVSYAELHLKTLSAPQVRTDRDGLNPTYSELNFRKEKPRIDEDEDPPISSGPGGSSTTAETVAQEQDAKVKIRNKTHRLICLLCLVMSALIVIVARLSINGMHSDLRHRFTEMEKKYRSVNETKAQICDFLNSRREKTCSQGWVSKKDRCYYVSTTETDFNEAMQQCANRQSRLLQIKSSDEASFASQNLDNESRTYWIGKCLSGNVGRRLLYIGINGTSICSQCKSYPCDGDRRFICERFAPVFPDILEKIQALCQQPVEAT